MAEHRGPLKRSPAFVPEGQGARNSLLGRAMLQRQDSLLSLFNEQWLSGREAAAALKVDITTLRRYISRGQLPATRLTPKGWLRIRASELQKFIEKGASS